MATVISSTVGPRACREQLAARLTGLFSGMQVAGTYSPPFREMTQAEHAGVVARINASKADVLWVGLGAPKQEKWMKANRPALDVPIMLGVGAAFDFHSGHVDWAPPLIRKAGLEWAYRLAPRARQNVEAEHKQFQVPGRRDPAIPGRKSRQCARQRPQRGQGPGRNLAAPISRQNETAGLATPDQPRVLCRTPVLRQLEADRVGTRGHAVVAVPYQHHVAAGARREVITSKQDPLPPTRRPDPPSPSLCPPEYTTV